MSTTLGFNSLLQFALPAGWDGGELAKHRLADGTSAEEFFADMVAALGGAAQDMLNDPFYGMLFSVTTELGAEYRQGNATTGMSKRSEFTRADPTRSNTVGHMYPLHSFDETIGFTYDFLRKARVTQLEANITDRLYDVRDEFERQLLTRLFSNADNQLGSSGYDVGFVRGGGAVSYVPPAWRGQTFAATHNHYDRKAATGEFDVALKAGVTHLWEHGISGPYIGTVPFAQRATYTGLTGFHKPDRDGLIYANTTNLANINEETYFGLFETDLGVVFLHASARVPSNYLGIVRGYGSNDPRNPLAVRVSPDYLFSPVAMRGEGFKQFPLENISIIHEYGVGVKDRLNGYACYFHGSGDYVVPAIS
jgi:hypothetical protein